MVLQSHLIADEQPFCVGLSTTGEVSGVRENLPSLHGVHEAETMFVSCGP